ncbi:hypothetical protein HH214_07950 [Mucilaginibacter robiniae]|uniref:Carboxypeptidase-like regulatory domain-containing protein n=1 Tax=Mucilaginibacter robiniae TaxID=2728022 RepID=A0A7L5DZZ5_9SPHI|nr:hypothetical protein [Mucilaginibacter robiniae]QJD95808.1 hypothetical protein HH214_07950 [Mucilaginibacter robiniae]
MKIVLLFLLGLVWAIAGFSQEKPVSGIVFSKTTQERIAKVSIHNTRSGETVYNTLKADFKINARAGDLLVFNKQGYFADTLKLQNTADLAVYIKPMAIMLKDVNIRDTLMSPQQRLALIKQQYNKAYGVLSNRDILSTSPGFGAGISIDAIWNMLSRSGRNAARLREEIDRDYRQNVIDYRFNKVFVQQITGLQDPQLTNFMTSYRPSYYMVTTANDYDFITYIKSNVKRFLRYPSRTTALVPFKLTEEK